MPWGKSSLVVLVLAMAAVCADQPQGLPLLPCGEGQPGAFNCNPSKKELKEAKEAYDKALKLQKAKRGDEAYAEFERAAQLAPRAIDYVTAREMARQQLVFEHLERGNADLTKGRQVEALAEFRSALHLDPENQFAQQRLNEALGEWKPQLPATPQVLADAGEIRVVPNSISADFHFSGDSRALLSQVAAVYGVVATVDDSVASRPVRFNIQNVDFFTAMRAAGEVTHSFWSPVGDRQIIVASDSPENHRQFDRLSLRTFYIPGAASPQQLNDVANLLRNVFEIRYVTAEPTTGTIVVRAPQAVLEAATHVLETMSDARPQVMLDVHVFEISHSLMRNFGIHIPDQFQLFNIPAAALAALGGQNIQDLINQLIAGGGINQANSQAISALLAQLGNQQNSLFSQPLATFGGGLTLEGLSLGTASGQLQINESSVKSLEHATLRVAQGNETNFKIGTRYPILNASFAPIFNTPAIAQNIQNNTFQSAFPSFSYEDLGLTIKAKPTVNGSSDVSLALEMQLRALGGSTLNGVPIINNREYKGSITLKDGEPGVVAGTVDHSEMRSLNGIPGLGNVPGLNKVVTSNARETDEDELLVVITPHVLTSPEHNNSEVWLVK